VGRALILGAVFIAASAAAAAAQPAAPSERWTFGGTAGVGRTWDDEGQIGGGVLAGGYVQWHWLSHTDVDAAVDLLTHNRTGGYFEAHGRTLLLSGALVQRFGGPSASGYVLGGLTLARHSGSAGFPADNVVVRTRGTRPGYIVGGGMMFRVRRRLDAGPMVRMALLTADDDSDPAAAIVAGVRVGFR
jgi:opacity protein-like surface antigen